MKNVPLNTKNTFLIITIAVMALVVVCSCLGGCSGCVSCAAPDSPAAGENSSSVSGSSDGGSTASDNSNDKGQAKPKNPVDFKTLQKRNSEIFAWLKVPGTNIDYPLLQSEVDDNYYLHRDVDKNDDYAGSIYMQYCNSSEMTDRVSVLYGHNMVDGSMFATLHRFRDEDFFKKHRYFYIYLPGQKLTYEVVSAYEFDSRHIMNSYNFAENKVFKEYLEYIQNPRSLYKNVRTKLDHKLSIKDRIVTLSTCLDYGDGRYLLQGVLVKDESTR